ncbi:hypothetical protein E1A91_D10G215400v1 [Gossypium mustelinum]|nr:hypothetical protein ES332_D10G228900v1 [Gossypium tomentosum]TYI62021.1 hypothetical protein E1A91_D10G215400v1 [Gossypium mustelinum]
MVIKVHGIPLSTCTARVLLCLCEKGLQYELVPVDPFGQIAALEDGDVKIFESRAICKYLARKYNETRITIDLLGSNGSGVSPIQSSNQALIRQMIVNPIYGIAPDEKIIEIELHNLAKVLDVYEERLSEYKYLGGDFYSMADLHHIPDLVYFMRSSKSSIVTSRPCVNAWWNDISSRPASVKVVELMKL